MRRRSWQSRGRKSGGVYYEFYLYLIITFIDLNSYYQRHRRTHERLEVVGVDVYVGKEPDKGFDDDADNLE